MQIVISMPYEICYTCRSLGLNFLFRIVSMSCECGIIFRDWNFFFFWRDESILKMQLDCVSSICCINKHAFRNLLQISIFGSHFSLSNCQFDR